MKFNVPSKQFYSYASAVSKIISSKNAVAILNNILITLKDDMLTIKASDMENSLEARLQVTEPEGEGSYCIDARRLVDLLKEMPDQGMTFEIHEDNLMVDITYPNGTYNLVAVRGDEYPQIETASADDTEGVIEFSAEASRLIGGIDNTIFAVSSDSLRPMMTGILWDMTKEGLVFVATDTRKLVKYTEKEIHSDSEGSFIMPVKTATVFKNAYAREDKVTVRATAKGVTLESEAFTFNSVLIKGKFPDYNRVIPTNNPYTLIVDRVQMLNAVRRVGGFVSADHGLIKFNMTPELLTLSATDNDFCVSARESVPCSFSGANMVMGFGAPYLIEILGTLSTAEMTIQLSDPSRPGVFTPSENKEGTELLMLLMPMTVID